MTSRENPLRPSKTESDIAAQLMRAVNACWRRQLPNVAEGVNNFRNEYGSLDALKGSEHVEVSVDRVSDRFERTIETKKTMTDLATGYAKTIQARAELTDDIPILSLYVQGSYPGEVTGYLQYECIIDEPEGTVSVSSHGKNLDGLVDEEITDLAEKIAVSAQIVAAIRAAISDVRTAHNSEPTNIH